ncbi:MAG TPA: thioredoxin domain-containing protein [Sphingomicrobium sp.]
MIKPATYFACAMALVAVAGCNKKQENASTTNNAAVKYENVKPPAGGDWTDVINATPDGGVMMGDPNAKVHLIEIGSLTCPHCREFDETAVTPMIEKYVKTGQISYEFRNYIRDTFDMSAVLIAHCNGPKAYFPLARALYKAQPDWVGKIQATPQPQLEQLQTMPENQIALNAAKIAGLQDWAAARGVPVAKSTQCLTDTKAIDRIVNQSGSIATEWPDFNGTPNFVINGTLYNKIGSWKEMDEALQSAVSG